MRVAIGGPQVTEMRAIAMAADKARQIVPGTGGSA